MKLIYFEVCKLFQRRAAWSMIVGLIFANALLIHYQINRVNEAGYSSRDIAVVYEKVKGKNSQEQLSWLEAEVARYIQGVQAGDERYTYGQDRTLILVYEQIAAVLDYDHYLADIHKQTEKMMKSALFAAPDTFSYRNIVLTRQAYAHLKGLEVPADFSDGVLLITDHRLTDAFLLLALVILTMHLLISEREEGTLPLFKATKYGHGSTIFAKAVVLLLLTLFLVLIFYSTNLIVAAGEVGLGDLNRPIQALAGYRSSPLKITVKQYLGLFFSAKLLGVLANLYIFFLLGILCRNHLFSCLLGILVFGLEALLYKNIELHSWLSPVRQFNLTALLDTGSYFSNYNNLNLFGYPVNTITAGVVTGFTAMIFGVVMGIFVFSKEAASDMRRNWLKEKLTANITFFKGLHFNLLRHEAYKLLIVNKGLLLILIFIVSQVFYFNGMMYFIDQEEFYYQNYSTMLAGGLTEEKSAFLQNEQERIAASEQERELLYQRYENGEIDERYLNYCLSHLEINGFKKRAFEKAHNQYLQLTTLQAKQQPVAYVYQTGWSKLFSQEANRLDLLDYGKTFLVLILALSSFEAIEEITSMNKIILVSKKGRKAVRSRKILICVCFAIISATISFLPRTMRVLQTYGASGLSAPAKSIMEISWAPKGLSIANFFVLYQVKRLVIAALAGVFILVVSHKTGNTITTILISTAVLILPLITLLLV
ncbi:MAG: hypothetical protein ACOX4N_06630 [Dethiobacteraceae bacterium]